MIFATGVVLVILGWFVINAYGDSFSRESKADYLGAALALIGLVLALGSLLHFTAKVLA